MEKRFQNCKIRDVLWKDGLPRLSFKVVNMDDEVYEVSIQNWNTKEQILQLLDRVRERAILACGMTDIDIYYGRAGQIVIDWSPCDGTSIYFEVPVEEIQKLL